MNQDLGLNGKNRQKIIIVRVRVCVCITISLSFHPLVDTEVVSKFVICALMDLPLESLGNVKSRSDF